MVFDTEQVFDVEVGEKPIDQMTTAEKLAAVEQAIKRTTWENAQHQVAARQGIIERLQAEQLNDLKTMVNLFMVNLGIDETDSQSKRVVLNNLLNSISEREAAFPALYEGQRNSNVDESLEKVIKGLLADEPLSREEEKEFERTWQPFD